MKKWSSALFAAIALFSLTACGGGNAPEAVAKTFIESMYTGDVKTAAGLVYLNEEEQYKPGIEEMVQGKLGMMSADAKREADRLGGFKDITTQNAVIQDNSAQVQVEVKFKNSDQVEKANISLRKNAKGDWKVKL